MFGGSVSETSPALHAKRAFCRKLAEAGVTFDAPYRRLTCAGTAAALLTDSWGTYIELTEGLDRL